MDDSRIKQLTQEVLSQIAGSSEPHVADLESRVAALEAAVNALRPRAETAGATVTALTVVAAHPSLQPLSVPGGADRCVLEPDKPCVQSGQCRALGH
jgi:hypothetical protein